MHTSTLLSFLDTITLQDCKMICNEYIQYQSVSHSTTAGDVLLEGGKPNPDAYILCDGSVEILKAGQPDGHGCHADVTG